MHSSPQIASTVWKVLSEEDEAISAAAVCTAAIQVLEYDYIISFGLHTDGPPNTCWAQNNTCIVPLDVHDGIVYEEEAAFSRESMTGRGDREE